MIIFLHMPMVDGGIIPEYFDDYNNDGEKDIIYISADEPVSVYYEHKDDTKATVQSIGLLTSQNFFFIHMIMMKCIVILYRKMMIFM